jgi:hypothetical protein
MLVPIGGVMVLTDRVARIRGSARAGAVVAFLVLIAPLAGGQPRQAPSKPGESESSAKTGKPSNEPAPINVCFRDGSLLKLTLQEEHIEFVTPYGKLLIPAADIRRIDFGVHLDAATAKRVEAAILKLGSTDVKERESATAALVELGENAYPALVEATHAKDAEVARRAEAIVNKLRETLPPDRLDRPANDVVVTADCRFTGRISADVFKVKTFQFGDQQVKLGDLACLGSKAYMDSEATFVGPGGNNFPGFGQPGGFQPGIGGRANRGGGGRNIRGVPGGFPPGAGGAPGGIGPGGGLPPPPNPPDQ